MNANEAECVDCVGEACVVQEMRKKMWRTRRESVPDQVDGYPRDRLLTEVLTPAKYRVTAEAAHSIRFDLCCAAGHFC